MVSSMLPPCHCVRADRVADVCSGCSIHAAWPMQQPRHRRGRRSERRHLESRAVEPIEGTGAGWLASRARSAVRRDRRRAPRRVSKANAYPGMMRRFATSVFSPTTLGDHVVGNLLADHQIEHEPQPRRVSFRTAFQTLEKATGFERAVKIQPKPVTPNIWSLSLLSSSSGTNAWAAGRPRCRRPAVELRSPDGFGVRK